MTNTQIYRAGWHDYSSRSIYMITLVKRPEIPAFAFVDGTELKVTRLGRMIQKQIIDFNNVEQRITVLQYIVMPDHVHVLLFVTESIPEKLGYYIARWKVGVNKFCAIDSIFEQGFNDQILHLGRSLKVLISYIRDNPRRLVVRKLFPDRFRRVGSLRIGEGVYRAYGNLHLLDNPFREQVVVHRADSEAVRSRNRDLWLYTAANGGVLVSPFISPDERAVLREAEALGGKVILITAEEMGDRYKPASANFDRCLSGRLLIISCPGSLSRAHCLAMNALAAEIAARQGGTVPPSPRKPG